MIEVLEQLAQALPKRFKAPHDEQPTPGYHVNPSGAWMCWNRLSFTSGPERAGWTVPTWEALGLMTVTLERELQERGWDWHTHNTGPAECRSHCAQVYPHSSAMSGMHQAYGDTPAHALALALLEALKEDHD